MKCKWCGYDVTSQHNCHRKPEPSTAQPTAAGAMSAKEWMKQRVESGGSLKTEHLLTDYHAFQRKAEAQEKAAEQQ